MPASTYQSTFKSKKNAMKKKKKSGVLMGSQLIQSRLTVGVSAQKTCRDCGMSYTSTIKYDASLHDKFHRLSMEGPEWPTSPKEKPIVVQSISSASFIAKIDSSSPLSYKRAVQQLVDQANRELNSPPIQCWKTGPGEVDANFKGVNTNNLIAYVCVVDFRAVSILLLEPIEEKSGAYLDVASGTIHPTTDPVAVGISRIYTTRAHRRRKYATRLLNACQASYVYGIQLQKSQMAWSQPSSSGAQLAKKWSGMTKIMTYVN